MANHLEVPLTQGDILPDIHQISKVSLKEGEAQQVDCPEGVVVVSQTCDALRNSCIQVAPIVILKGQDAAVSATGRRPRYIPIPRRGVDRFVDLNTICTLDRGPVLLQARPSSIESGITDERSERLFREAVGRRFSRFPFPDAVTEWCRPLSDKVARKALHSDTKPEGARLQEITEIRIMATSGWDNGPYELELDFVLEADVLPEPDRDLTEDETRNLESMSASGLAKYISRLYEEPAQGTAALLSYSWNQLVNSWVQTCNTKYHPESNNNIPVHGSGLLCDLDEYLYSRATQSERLDLTYLSHGESSHMNENSF